MKKIIKSTTGILFYCICLFLTSTTAKAYTLNGYKFSSPNSISYYVDSSLSSYSVNTYLKKWKRAYSSFGFTNALTYSSANIYFTSFSSVDNGTYGVTYHNQNGAEKHMIIFYKAFFDASSSVRNETIVHECGHALGLAHPSAPVNMSAAVMRATGFNGKAYPLSDDISGINALYY
nr:matrixin family metalloprotease [uncultured Lachnoclostridium sp.]